MAYTVEHVDVNGAEHTATVRGVNSGTLYVSFQDHRGITKFTCSYTAEELEENYENPFGELDEDGLWQMVEDTFVAYIEQAGF